MLPDEAVHEADERVSSFWIEGGPVVLQVSSYLKPDGRAMPAQQRLQERIAKSAGQWQVWENSPFRIDGTEQAIAETVDTNGLLWLHAYIVWPHLTVYATVSGPQDEIRNRKNWAIRALQTLRLTVQ